MDVYEAIRQMRTISADGGSFSFSFMSFDSTRMSSEGVVYVARARLRSRESVIFNGNAEMMEAYYNLDTSENRQFYQPLLMTFNGKKITL